MQRVGFEGLAAVLGRHPEQHPGAREIHGDGDAHDRKGPNGSVHLGVARSQPMNGLLDDPGAGGQQQERFDQRREILHFAVPVGMVPVRGLAGRAHREASHHGRRKIQPRVGRLRENAHAPAQQPDHHLQAGQQEGGND